MSQPVLAPLATPPTPQQQKSSSPWRLSWPTLLTFIGIPVALIIVLTVVDSEPSVDFFSAGFSFLRAHRWSYFFSVLFGAPVTMLFSASLHWLIRQLPTNGKDGTAETTARPGDRVLWIPALTGVMERFAVTTMCLLQVSGLGGFLAGWIALKLVGGWQRWKDDSTYSRALFAVGALGSLVSLLIAIVAAR
jgi:hypothetical protein